MVLPKSLRFMLTSWNMPFVYKAFATRCKAFTQGMRHHLLSPAGWKPNAGRQARLKAEARHERTLEAVAWTPWLGVGNGRDTVLTCLHHGPGTSPAIPSTPSSAR